MNSTSTSLNGKKPNAGELCLLALMGALMIGLKVAMASLPNIEPVSLLIVLTMLVFGWKGLYSVAIYVLLEGLIYGFGIWFISYLYFWPILAVATMAVRKTGSTVFLVILSTVFGLAFGALCAIPYFVVGGWAAGFSYWISGIPFDLLHAAGNAVLGGILLAPLSKLLCKLTGRSAPCSGKADRPGTAFSADAAEK